MTIDAPAIRGAYQPPHVTGNGLDRFPPTGCGIRWDRAWTEQQRERIAENAIRTLGFESYLPLFLNVRRFSRSEIVPLFSRYVLVRFDAAYDDWGKIRTARGVGGIIRHGPGLPTSLPDHAIDELLARTSTRGVVDDPGERAWEPLQAGQRPVWQDMAGLDAAARSRLLIRLFGASASRIVTEDAAA